MEANSIVNAPRDMGGAQCSSPEAHHEDSGRRAELAMLIDIENAAPKYMDEAMRRATQYGEVTRRLAFGTITDGKWTKQRLNHAIRWGTQSHIKTSKNCADIELTIAAMDLLNDRSVRGFCIVSSDSDFTPLVMRLREAQKLVIGIGEKKTPEAFVNACDHFEMVGGKKASKSASAKTGAKAAPGSATKPKGNSATKGQDNEGGSKASSRGNDRSKREFLELVKKAAKGHGDDDGWIWTAVLGSALRKLKSGIRYADYGHRTLIGVLKTYPEDIETRRHNSADQIRMKR